MSDKKVVSLVLEGGGVKCAYQVGAIMALEELGYSFNAISGASYGAVNGALYIEGGTKRLFDYFNSLKSKDIFVDDVIVDFIENYQDDRLVFTNRYFDFLKEHVPHLMEDRREISDYYHSYITHLVNERAVRKSDIAFMCSALEVENSPLVLPVILGSYFARNMGPIRLLEESGAIKSHIINKETCNKGTLAQYVAASANYPFFNPLEVEGKYYLDGGITNNVPYEALLDLGYENLIIIRTKSDDLQGKIPQNDNILTIVPSENLGSSIFFTHDNIVYLMKLGYIDTMNQLRNKLLA